MFYYIVSSLLLLGTILPSLSAGDPPQTRPFHMGFTRWPADFTLEGMITAEKFAHDHGDIVSVMFIGGVPWSEALAGQPFSQDVQNNFKYRPPQGRKLFLSISPLNMDRKALAPYWGSKDNLPLPKPWNTAKLDDPDVKKAYLQFVLRAVEAMKPDYLAIGIENNVLLSNDARKWAQLKTLHAETYAAVKEKHPALPVFFTTEVMHYKKLATEARKTDQVKEVAEMMQHSDYFAMSFYPHMSYDVPKPLPANFFDFARDYKKPIAVSETGMTSRDVELKSFKVTLRGSEAEQKQYLDLLLSIASRDHYQFVVQFATTDFEKLCEKLPAPVNDMARIWCFTGMQTSDKKPKPALQVWENYFKARYNP